MEHIVQSALTAEDHYEVLDAYLTDILASSGADIGEEPLKLLVAYNRHLRIALGTG